MFDSVTHEIEPNRVTKYQLTRDGSSLTFLDVLDLWSTESEFREYFTAILAASPFLAYRWETPRLDLETVNDPFEFVLLNTPTFGSRKTDAVTYDEYFTADDTGVVTFANLRGDATLIVPSPRTEVDAYGHLAAFVRHAPSDQHHAFWQTIGMAVNSKLSSTPIWLSTAGGGVAWLHVRIDDRPKYYGYAPFKVA